MLEQVLFALYFIVLIMLVIFAGVNYYRLRDKKQTNPQIIVFLLPFIVNYIFAKAVFQNINPLFTTLFPCLLIFFIGRRLKNVRIFGLTGGIATGKSTLGRQMKKNLPKLKVIDCDEITTQLRNRGNRGYSLILKMLGDKSEQFVQPVSKQINRQKLSKFVFEDNAFRRQLTTKMGRYILWQIIKDIFKSVLSSQNLIMIDAPILYESKVLQYICYPIIVVGCSQQQQIARLQKRNDYSKQEAIKRIRSQMPLSVKQKKSDIYVKNQGTEQDLLKNTLVKLNKFLHKDK